MVAGMMARLASAKVLKAAHVSRLNLLDGWLCISQRRAGLVLPPVKVPKPAMAFGFMHLPAIL